MKKSLLLTAVIALSLTAMSQEKSQKPAKAVKVQSKSSHTSVSHKGGKNNGHDDVYQAPKSITSKYSKNTPAKVSESFMRDYPNASNVTWTKNQGYWMAVFSDGLYRTSVRYAANGERTNTTRKKMRM